jgi:hypothetical protein
MIFVFLSGKVLSVGTPCFHNMATLHSQLEFPTLSESSFQYSLLILLINFYFYVFHRVAHKLYQSFNLVKIILLTFLF